MKQISLTNRLKYIVIILTLAFGHEVFGLEQDDFNKILNKYKLNKDDFGVLIESHEKTIFENNSKKMYIPASISKLITTFSVLKNFNLNQKFKTELYYDGENLYIKGGGDPSFVSENMWYLVNEFTDRILKL